MLRELTDQETEMISGGDPGDTYDSDMGTKEEVQMTTVDRITLSPDGTQRVYIHQDWGYAGEKVGKPYAAFRNLSTGY